MSPRKKELSKAEWKVMNIVWRLKKAMAREVYTVAADEHGWSPATVKTMLKRLTDKGYLSVTVVGNGFVYRPTESALTTFRAAADSLLANAVEEVTGPLLAHMVNKTALSQADLDDLRQLIDEKKAALAKPQRSSKPRTRKGKP